MVNIKRFWMIAVLLSSGVYVHAQDGKKASKGGVATGSIRDAATGKVLNGAKISYLNSAATITDSAGNFSIKVPDYKVTLHVEADGYQAKEIALKGEHNVMAALYENGFTSYYDEISLPFNIAPKSALTNAATSVQVTNNSSLVGETPDSYLQGKVPGLNAIRRSGTPNIGANLFLRGYSSLYATNQPLIVVDGIVFDISSYGSSLIENHYNNPLQYIDVKDIDNITVLKDGSSTYGTKGANGVILVTTARARQEATKIDVALYGGANIAPDPLPVMNASDYRIMLDELLQSKGMTAKDIQSLPYMNDDPSKPGYYMYHNSTDWQKQVLKNSSIANGYLKITGGDNVAKYALSMGFLKNNGVIASSGLSRYNTRFNADFNLSRRLTAATNLSFTYTEQQLKDQGANYKTNPIYAALIKSPFLSTHEVADNGIESPSLADADIFGKSNPVAIIQNMQALNKNYRFIGSVNFNYSINKNISLASTLAVTMDKVRESFFVPQAGVVGDTLDNAIALNQSGAQVLRMFSVSNDTRLSYTKTINNIHSFAARVGFRYIKSTSEQDNGFGYNSATDDMKGVGYGLNSLRRIGGTMGEWRWFNTYFNADYNLRSKYFLSFNMAIDGSSRFGTDVTDATVIHFGNNNYPLMPSLSGAWLVSSENFMSRAKWINLLKLRASVGMTGNDDIGNFTSRKYYTSQNLLGIEGLVRGNAGNPSLQWEAATKLNGGLDVSLFNERLSISADVYHNKTDKMIVYEPAATATGMDYMVTNSGGMKTNGYEVNVNARLINNKNFKWDLGFNIAQYKSTITKLPVDQIITDFADASIITKVGSAPNLFYGYKTKGVYATSAQALGDGLSTKNATGGYTAFRAGDVQFVNSNMDKVIDEKDKQVIGNPNPDFFGAITSHLSYKNFSLDLLFTYSKGNDVYNYTRRQLESMSGYENQTLAAVNRWRTEWQVTNVPRATWGDPAGNSRFSDRWIEDGSYIRLRTASLSYDVPMKPRFVKYASIYATANNLLTFTKYLGYDPEFSATSSVFGQGVDAVLEPQYKSFQLGLRLGL
ncbi:SusC/RagA family TonB-linked outer membrane protein [Pinibacter soli]|uniref:SusC/RagA family TonB-linked outer membrane protein n=1 Tax=Pinibacter soli TaxID=3044211 RepID=A0ABT6R9N0_9BACT|nr:SusC/RagA family TonB-linked outer membrane protein [Pinibacter soli]MDI3319213.1 SusC/RagA family TonB-linked outer membrane protein [Pinibacter soli]